MIGLVQQAGHDVTADASSADVLVVNTCAFIDSAKQESVDTILELAELKRSVAAGDWWSPAAWPNAIAGNCSSRSARLTQCSAPVKCPTSCARSRRRSRAVRRGVPMQFFRKPPAPSAPAGDACGLPEYLYDGGHAPHARDAEALRLPSRWRKARDYTCAFCIIRPCGPIRSRTPQSILAEARHLADQGVRELPADFTGHDVLRRGPGRTGRDRQAPPRLIASTASRDRLLYSNPTTSPTTCWTRCGERPRSASTSTSRCSTPRRAS